VVTSDDGLLTLSIPLGAVPDGVSLTAEARGESDLPLELRGLEVRSAFYELLPADIAFASPVTVTRRVSYDDLALDPDVDGLPVLALALRAPDASWQWLDAQELISDGEFVTVSGQANHGGLLFAFGGTSSVLSSWSVPSLDVPVGSSATLSVSLAYPVDATDPPALGVFEAFVANNVVEAGSSSVGQGGSSFRTNVLTCSEPAPVSPSSPTSEPASGPPTSEPGPASFPPIL